MQYEEVHAVFCEQGDDNRNGNIYFIRPVSHRPDEIGRNPAPVSEQPCN